MGKQAARIPALLLSAVLLASGVLTLLRLQRQIAEAKAILAQRESEVRLLRRENELLTRERDEEDERERTERIARGRLGLLYPDEKVIIILGD